MHCSCFYGESKHKIRPSGGVLKLSRLYVCDVSLKLFVSSLFVFTLKTSIKNNIVMHLEKFRLKGIVHHQNFLVFFTLPCCSYFIHGSAIKSQCHSSYFITLSFFKLLHKCMQEPVAFGVSNVQRMSEDHE